jgi:hypothetical protein
VSEPSFDELLRRLVEAEVNFVLVGGLAVNAWGVVRGTKDVDIAADPDAENLMALGVLTRRSRAMKRAAGRTRDLADLEDLDDAHGQG